MRGSFGAGTGQFARVPNFPGRSSAVELSLFLVAVVVKYGYTIEEGQGGEGMGVESTWYPAYSLADERRLEV